MRAPQAVSMAGLRRTYYAALRRLDGLLYCAAQETLLSRVRISGFTLGKAGSVAMRELMLMCSKVTQSFCGQ